MAIMKLLLLVVVVPIQQYATKSPNVRPPAEQLREQRGSEHAIPYLAVLTRTVVWFWAFLEGLVLFAQSGHCPPSLAYFCFLLHPSSVSNPKTTSPSPTFLAGSLLSLTGSLLRIHCFRTLGQRFTFELSICPSHTLVTHGVYSVVRHPSYTGIFMLAIGWLLCVLDRQGWLAGACATWVHTLVSSGGDNGRPSELSEAIMTGALACVWATMLVILWVGANQRMDKEDDMLEKNFGEEWRAWARRVPHRLIPGIY